MARIEPEATMSDADFGKLRSIVYDNIGISIGDNRKTMLVSRLRSRLRETGEVSFKSYISRIAKDPDEMQELTNRVTTNETYFYRTPRVWTHFREVVLPDFKALGQKRPMKVWSAAASTGEEAHTMGVLLEEERLATPGFEYSVLGTDVSSRVIKVCEEGHYKGRPVARFQKEEPALFAKHMVGTDEAGYHAAPQIRQRIKFKLHNLLHPLANAGPFDVVFLRNVLIYFTNEDQEKILAHVHKVLRPSGTLVIGESETLTHLNTRFDPVVPLVYHPAGRASS